MPARKKNPPKPKGFTLAKVKILDNGRTHIVIPPQSALGKYIAAKQNPGVVGDYVKKHPKKKRKGFRKKVKTTWFGSKSTHYKRRNTTKRKNTAKRKR